MANIFKKQQYLTDPKTGKRILVKTSKWYGRYRDADGTEHRVPLSTDKRIAQRLLDDIIKQVERHRYGIFDEVVVEMQKSLADHINDFECHLRAKNDSEYHIRTTINMIKKVAAERKWKDLRNLKAFELEAFLTKLRNERHLSIERCNHYVRAFKTFAHWLMDNDRINKDPFRKIKVLNASMDPRRQRRPLSMEEFTLLISTASSGPPIQGFSGQDRTMLYYVAAWTGLRRKRKFGQVIKIDSIIFSAREDPSLDEPSLFSLSKTCIYS